MNLKEALKGKLTEKELQLLRRSFEIIGDIAIIEIPPELEDKKDLIIEALLTIHKNLKTVLQKTGEVSGTYRVAKYRILHGYETETTCKESGCVFKLDPTKVYFSSRLATERERIRDLVNDGEGILCMFAGVGPYPIVIAKKKNVRITGIELNPKAYEYFLENIRRNKVEDRIEALLGDVKEVIPSLGEKFDRILMPSPFIAEDYVYLLPHVVDRGTIVHYYTLAGEEDEKELPNKVERALSQYRMKSKVLFFRRVGSYAPRVNRYVTDIEIKDIELQ